MQALSRPVRIIRQAHLRSARRLVPPLLCFAAAVSGQNSPGGGGPEARGSGANNNDARAIIQKTVERDARNYHELQSWTYKVSDRIEKLDASGRTRKVESTVDEVLYIGGRPYIHPLEKDGKPLPPKEAAREQAKLDKATAEAGRLTEAERRRREQQTEKRREKEREQLRDLPDAFVFTRLGEDVINGRPAWRIRATPLRSYRGKYASLLKNLEGALWIDEQEYQFVKADVHAIRGFSIGLFLGSVAEGSRLYFETIRLPDGLWVTSRLGFEGSARVLVRRVRQNEELVFSDFRKFQSDSRMVDAEP